mmetsp:Transcript_14233/g.23267  ORF Transcript_14233/g.23267 Transcript_14233/m.23267 type:complete len:89 (-) Transcript_14233:172-438(-)
MCPCMYIALIDRFCCGRPGGEPLENEEHVLFNYAWFIEERQSLMEEFRAAAVICMLPQKEDTLSAFTMLVPTPSSLGVELVIMANENQ